MTKEDDDTVADPGGKGGASVTPLWAASNTKKY